MGLDLRPQNAGWDHPELIFVASLPHAHEHREVGRVVDVRRHDRLSRSETELERVRARTGRLHADVDRALAFAGEDVEVCRVLDAGVDVGGYPTPSKQLGLDGFFTVGPNSLPADAGFTRLSWHGQRNVRSCERIPDRL